MLTKIMFQPLFSSALKSILFVIIVILLVVAMPEGKPENFDPFMPYGADGVFSGTAAVFFAFTGYDAACYMAEEVSSALPSAFTNYVERQPSLVFDLL